MEMEIEIPEALVEPLLIQAAIEEVPVEEIVTRAIQNSWKEVNTVASDGKKGITVKVDSALHAEITQYLQDHGMTMTEFGHAGLAG